MKLELEHGDIIKACAYYLSTKKNFQVEAKTENFPFKFNDLGELECVVRNGDMGPPPEAPRPARAAPEPAASVPRKAAFTAQPRAEPPPKNSMFVPVREPSPTISAPKMRYLDPELAGSSPPPGNFSEPEPARAKGVIIDPSELSEEDRAVLADVLSRSQVRGGGSAGGVGGDDIPDDGEL